MLGLYQLASILINCFSRYSHPISRQVVDSSVMVGDDAPVCRHCSHCVFHAIFSEEIVPMIQLVDHSCEERSVSFSHTKVQLRCDFNTQEINVEPFDQKTEVLELPQEFRVSFQEVTRLRLECSNCRRD